MDNNETRLNDSNVVFDEDGMKVLTKCKNCGGDFWVKQGKVFKKWFKGRCPVCGWTTIAKVGVRKVQTDENGEKIEPFKDEEKIIEYLNRKSIEDVDPMLCAAANMIRDLSDRHWSECWQIGVYSDKKPGIRGTEDEYPNIGEIVLAWNGLAWELARVINDGSSEGGCLLWESDPYGEEHDYFGLYDWEYWTYLPNDPRKEDAND